MILTRLEDVFGVSTKPVLSYVQRESVDTKFLEALRSDKQLVVYGSSKQGKTSLVSAYLPYDKNLVVSLSPKHQIRDIYSSILRQLNIKIEAKNTLSTGREFKGSVEAKAKAGLFLVGSGECSGKGEAASSTDNESEQNAIGYNLELPQDVCELVRKTGTKKTVILENFHYLDDEKQKQLAYDLRTYHELGMRFVILGVWREKNRLVQFNGDLADRIVEIPVEPWLESDFQRVAKKGSTELNIEISTGLIGKCCECSFSSIGVFQELLKETCATAGISRLGLSLQKVDSDEHLRTAINRKAEEYASRHQRGLETIACGNISSTARDGILPLFLPYYLVKVILQEGFDGLCNGMRRAVIHEKIQSLHHRPDDVRGSDISNLLHNLATMQSNKSISPPIIDYDKSTKMLQVVDSTFHFFLKNANLAEISEEIPNPLA